MRRNRLVKIAPKMRTALFLAPVLALTVVGTAYAQDPAGDTVLIDVSDPNVSIDLSVLDDGGLTPHVGAPLSGGSSQTMQGSSFKSPGKSPGAKAPVSTLYIQPSQGLKLPPQTKPIFKVPAAAEPATKMAVTPPAPAPKPTESHVTVAPPPPPAAAPVIVEKPVPQAAPAQVAEPKPVPAPEPVKEVVKVAPAPVAAPAPAAPPAAPKVEEAPAQANVQPGDDTPPPPPQALTQPATPPAEKPQAVQAQAAPAAVDETQTAPAPTGTAVVVDLPPKASAPAPAVASLPPATGPLGDGDNMRIVFEADSSKLPQDARNALKALSDQMGKQDALRLQLLAYAGNTDTSASAARRLSLSRALAVRSFLIENGVRSTRIDVRALGNKSTDEVTERVDITVVER